MVARISLCADSTASFPFVPVAVLGKWWLVTHYKSSGMTGSNQFMVLWRYSGVLAVYAAFRLWIFTLSRGIDTTIELDVTRIISFNIIYYLFSFLEQPLRISHVRRIFYTSFAAWGKPTQAVIRTLADLPVSDQGHGICPAPKQ